MSGASRTRTGDLLGAIRASGGLPVQTGLAQAVLGYVRSARFSQFGRPVSRSVRSSGPSRAVGSPRRTWTLQGPHFLELVATTPVALGTGARALRGQSAATSGPNRAARVGPSNSGCAQHPRQMDSESRALGQDAVLCEIGEQKVKVDEPSERLPLAYGGLNAGIVKRLAAIEPTREIVTGAYIVPRKDV